MPSRGRRGGRGGAKRAGGRGGGNFGRFRTNNSKKRKSKGTSNNHRSSGPKRDFPELMDLSGSVYIPEYGETVSKTNMKNLGRRPRTMMSEALYTGAHIEATMNLPMRKRPVEFVKAKETYDPNKELKDRFEKVSLKEKDAEDVVEVSDAVTDKEGSPEVELDKAVIDPEEEHPLEKPQQQTENDEGSAEEVIAEDEAEDIIIEPASPQGVDFVIDDEGDNVVVASKIPKLKTSMIVDKAENIDHDSTITIGNVTLQTAKNEKGELVTELMAIDELNRRARPGFVNESQPNLDSDSEEEVGDPQGYDDYINQIMHQMRDDSDFGLSDEYESDTNFDVMASDSDEDDQEQVEEDAALNDEQEEEEEKAEAEYGFLEEDYDFDVSRISVSNVRLGMQNQYYTSCMDLNGTTEFVWVPESDVIDYVLESGVKEHRLQSFLKFLTKDLIEEEEQPNYSDVYISETSDEEIFEEQEELEEEEEDEYELSDMLSFAKSRPANMNNYMDFEPTSTLKTKGKGKNKQLVLDNLEMDHELRQYLQKQYQSSRQTRKVRKEMKEIERVENGIAKHDLFVKYPYTLHILDIRQEMDALLLDSSRERVKFPPLDPHGNKTVKKMAELFNFKCKRCGNKGLNMFMEVYKYKRTYKYLPNTNGIYALTKQRPIFHRSDVKRPKNEIVETDGNKDKDRRRGRNRDTNASVKEGDIVGEKAPEIGANNIGRQLLERMGWSKGQGLGAIGNQGINEPVIAKVKITKLGLK